LERWPGAAYSRNASPASSIPFLFFSCLCARPFAGAIWSCCGAADDALVPAEKGFVRGYNTPGLTGWVLEPLGATGDAGDATAKAIGCRMHYIVHSDIRGWIPKAVVNAAMSSNFVTFYETLDAFLQQQRAAGKI
jgi:hypothetical protein